MDDRDESHLRELAYDAGMEPTPPARPAMVTDATPLPCPFCNAVPEEWSGIHRHPDNECFLAGQTITRLTRAAWNTRLAMHQAAMNGDVVERLQRIAEDLVRQDGEPWPDGTAEKRLHYWRDKAINASRSIASLMGSRI